MKKTVLLAVLAGGFLLLAAWMFGVDKALELFQAVQPALDAAGEGASP
jgi:hypothetical protein